MKYLHPTSTHHHPPTGFAARLLGVLIVGSCLLQTPNAQENRIIEGTGQYLQGSEVVRGVWEGRPVSFLSDVIVVYTSDSSHVLEYTLSIGGTEAEVIEQPNFANRALVRISAPERLFFALEELSSQPGIKSCLPRIVAYGQLDDESAKRPLTAEDSTLIRLATLGDSRPIVQGIWYGQRTRFIENEIRIKLRQGSSVSDISQLLQRFDATIGEFNVRRWATIRFGSHSNIYNVLNAFSSNSHIEYANPITIGFGLAGNDPNDEFYRAGSPGGRGATITLFQKRFNEA